MTIYTAKWPDASGHIAFTEIENETWHTLYTRQLKTIQNRATIEFITGLKELNFDPFRIPQLKEVNTALQKTGWKMLPVSGTVLVDEFFTMLSQKTFPVANFIRIPEELDYLQQPDIFHELFGHGPLLMNHHYADFMQWYGQTALSLTAEARKIFSRLFWFTVEFGLIDTEQGLRIYGGGILSSFKETIFSLESAQPQRLLFDAQTILNTPYRYDQIQNIYFFLQKGEGLSSLFELRHNADILKFLISSSGKKSDQIPFVTC